MGGDGGTKQVKRDSARGAKPVSGSGTGSASTSLASRDRVTATGADRDLDAATRATTCALSGEPLDFSLASRGGILACELGALYNKEAVVEALLRRKQAVSEDGGAHASEPALEHIRGMKDVVVCQAPENPPSHAGAPRHFQCPVTLLECNGKTPFVVLWPKGDVVSRRAIEQLPRLADGQRVVGLFPSAEDKEKRRREILERHAADAARKLEKKRKKEKKAPLPESSSAVAPVPARAGTSATKRAKGAEGNLSKGGDGTVYGSLFVSGGGGALASAMGRQQAGLF